jgi:hypothetical protein
MTKAPFEVWIEAVKERAIELGLDYADLADIYSFREAYDFDMRPNEALEDVTRLLVLELKNSSC